MLNLGQTGIASVAAVMVLVAVAGGAVGTPVAMDSLADQQPDSPLYALERLGERIKEATYAGGSDWNLDRARERIEEYRQVSGKEVSNNHIGLLEDAGNNLTTASRKAGGVAGLERVQQATRNHIRVLENLKEEVSDSARPAVERALIHSRYQERVLENVSERLRAGILSPRSLKGELENRDFTLEDIRDLLENKGVSLETLEEIMENRDIPLENLSDFLKGKRVSPLILWQVLDREFENVDSEDIEELIQRIENRLGNLCDGDELTERVRERLEQRLEQSQGITERIRDRLTNLGDLDKKVRERLENELREMEGRERRIREMLEKRFENKDAKGS